MRLAKSLPGTKGWGNNWCYVCERNTFYFRIHKYAKGPWWECDVCGRATQSPESPDKELWPHTSLVRYPKT